MASACRFILDGGTVNLDEIDGDAALFYAAKYDHPRVIRELNWKGLDLDVIDDAGKSAVFYANQNQNLEALCKLIELGAEFNLDEIDGDAALFYAAKYNNSLAIVELDRKGLDLNVIDDGGKSAVFYASQNRNLHALCKLIELDAEFNLDEIDGNAALFYAAKNNHRWVIRELKRKGHDLDVIDDGGKSAVFYANQKKNLAALCDLIGRGAEFNLDEIDGVAALFYAAKYNYSLAIVELDRKGLDLNVIDDSGKRAMFYAGQKQNLAALCTLIGQGAEFNLDEIDGNAALFYAAKHDYSFVIVGLDMKGLDLNVIDTSGKRAVIYASQKKNWAALCDLIELDAEFNLDEINGHAALFYAAKYNYSRAIMKLEYRGLDLDVIDDAGKSAMFYASLNQNLAALCELIKSGAEFNLDEINGNAALFYAAKRGIKHVVKPLHDAGLDLNITDDKGKTVVFYCDEEFLNALMALDDVLINARDIYGRTPLFYALLDHTPKRARYLVKKGANLQLKDNCNANIFSSFMSKNIDALQLFTSELFQEEQQLKSLILAILDTVYCQAPLLSVSGSPDIPKLHTIFNKANILKGLAFARNQCLIHDAKKVKNIDKIAIMICKDEIDVLLVLSLLNKLGANPNAVDSDGNTAVHYATLLPFFSVKPTAVIDICKKLRKFGAFCYSKNHQRQSPLLFCLSSNTWENVTGRNWQPSLRGLVEVCRFLLNNGCSITNGSQKDDSIFHRTILLMQQLNLQVNEHPKTKLVLQVLIDVFVLFEPRSGTDSTRKAFNNFDSQLNSPLHLWASIALKSPQDYTSNVTEDHTFESFMRIILDCLFRGGANLNARNVREETPLHVCKTWAAVKLLLVAGANPNDVDASGNSPLLVAVKNKNIPKNTSSFYPDVTEEPETFWSDVLEKGLHPLVVNKKGESLLSVLIKMENFRLARALVEVVCKENYVTNEAKLLLLDTICRDESKRTHWKTILVEIILKNAGTGYLSLDSPLRFCCRNIVKFGLRDDKPHSIQHNPSDETSNDDVQPPPKKRKKSVLAKDEGKKEKSKNEERRKSDSVHCKIAKQLILHGVDIHSRDSSGMSCLDIAKDCPSLEEFLNKPIEIDTLPILIPWTSVSEKCNSKLAKVARRQECEMMGQIWCHQENIGNGSFALVFAGINEKDGREVAVKRVEKLRMKHPEDKREIQNLTALADCEHVVRYISFFEDVNFSYIVLELMEGDLDECLGGSTINAADVTRLCKHIIMGVKFLHQQKILHRDLKPGNILYKVNPEPHLKIADFGLSRIAHSKSTTVYRTHAGTRCWMAPELLTRRMNSFQPDSDIFSCGMLLHYILSGQKHPFSPTDCDNKTELQVCHETEGNIMNGKLEGWDGFLHPEAIDLVKRMLESNEKDRPSAREAQDHPLFWSNKKKIDFLEAVGNQEEFMRSRSKRTPTLTHVETDLENSFRTIVKHGTWKSSKYKNMPDFYKDMTKWRKYDTSSAVELVRFIRNVYEHFRGITFVSPVPIEDLLFTDFVFLENFPHLVMEVYKAVTAHGWDNAKEDIKCAMNK